MLAGLAAGALALSACSTDDGGGGAAGSRSITIAATNPLTSLNSNNSEGNLVENGMVQFLTNQSSSFGYGSFHILDENFVLDPQEQIGSVEQLSEDPLRVRYTLAEDLEWSNGEPITNIDMLFAWLVNSGWADDAELDADSGEVTGGTVYFALAGSTTGLDTTDMPELGDDGRSLTLTYAEPYVDWELVNPIDLPAHVMADEVDMTLEELETFIREIPRGDPAAPAQVNAPLRAIADFWNTGYSGNEMPEDERLTVASGPFKVVDMVPMQSVTLQKNDRYPGADDIQFDELVIRFIGDANAQITALRNEEVDAIYPQASADTLTALEDLDVTILTGDEVGYDHLDLNFASEPFRDRDTREAFLRTVPRQQILDSIVKPVNPDAEVLNSQIFVPENAPYAESTARNGYDAFTEPDLDRARELLGGATPTVKILYNNENPNRVDSFQAIKNSAEQAGFVIEDGGSPDWSQLLSAGDYDASIFGWSMPGIGSASLPQLFTVGGGGNYNNYSNAEVETLVDESQRSLDPARVEEIKVLIDTATATDRFGLPLFQLPGIFAHNDRVVGIEYFGGQQNIIRNAPEWSLSAQ
ncbi:ABC transporter family substrate-binding protein [Leucobacter sp. M11]|uniref:ABC transporter family substrate-binding protein n=1 Tax=Leucobacter sp. M11 TaxID=2993565 RepID=UPI002D7F679E|nr:ABC transporter family substrate-binding protein [Leucobacter sp. M11]MEB4613838.1 ABC transporter family substrate-binding protein [Leucobacter sp. M11]